MKLFFEHLDDIIALIIVIGCFTLIGFGIDGEVKAILVLAAEYSFLKHIPDVRNKLADK